MAIKKGSMREVVNNIYQLLINDEELLRLLWYKPIQLEGIDPLDTALLNVKDMADYWDIVNNRIMLAEKENDLINDPICRLYISAGRRRPVFNNYLLATQEIVISMYVHEDYELDGRSNAISDRVSELIALEYVNGSIGKIDFVGGNARVAPVQYRRYDLIFEYTTNKK